jgi:8-oxo-dGTP pyrophosphatase MutT (NUDIX family)
MIELMELDVDWYADENLNCIVSEGLAGLSLATAQIITDWAKETPPLDLKALFRFIGVLREFSVSMLLGTYTVNFPRITVSDFTWENHLSLIRLDEVEDALQDEGEEMEEVIEEPGEKPRKSSSFEELLRQLQAIDNEMEEDHNPEDDEDFEEDCEDEEMLLPGPSVHPRIDEHGKPVKLAHPSTPTAQWTWMDAESIAIVIPDGPMPASLAGIAFDTWREAPRDNSGWERLADGVLIDEPGFHLPKGKKAAAGVVVLEEDGRVWAVAPSNAFGNYPATFPKGTCESDLSLQATAMREAYEEAGLQVELTGFLVDVPRSTSYTRYYLGSRIAGHPGSMGWESQAVMLVPVDRLPEVLTNKNDTPIIKALRELLQ